MRYVGAEAKVDAMVVGHEQRIRCEQGGLELRPYFRNENHSGRLQHALLSRRPGRQTSDKGQGKRDERERPEKDESHERSPRAATGMAIHDSNAASLSCSEQPHQTFSTYSRLESALRPYLAAEAVVRRSSIRWLRLPLLALLIVSGSASAGYAQGRAGCQEPQRPSVGVAVGNRRRTSTWSETP